MTNITGLQGIGALAKGAGTEKTSDTGAMFKDMLDGFIDQANNDYAVSKNDTEMLLSGQTDDIASVFINGAKAELSLNLVIQVRNKVIDAYNEVMRMQV